MKHLTDIDLIQRQRYPDETLAEYERCGDVILAIRTVNERHPVSREQQEQLIERAVRAYEVRACEQKAR